MPNNKGIVLMWFRTKLVGKQEKAFCNFLREIWGGWDTGKKEGLLVDALFSLPLAELEISKGQKGISVTGGPAICSRVTRFAQGQVTQPQDTPV